MKIRIRRGAKNRHGEHHWLVTQMVLRAWGVTATEVTYVTPSFEAALRVLTRGIYGDGLVDIDDLVAMSEREVR